MMEGREDLDLSSFFENDLLSMEECFVGEYLYKYYGESRRSFFSRPAVRFTIKDDLNDPFELTSRWDKIYTGETSQYISQYALKIIREKLKSEDYVKGKLRGEYEFPEGMSERNKNRIVNKLYKKYLERKIDKDAELIIEASMPQLMDSFLSRIPSSISSAISTMGIFSTSELADSPQLWALYANSGKGFAVELRVSHQFFQVSNIKKNVFRRVLYTDNNTTEFLRNPYYLFLVKGAQWAFEREWRAVKSIEDCDLQPAPGVHIWMLPVGTVSSIIFGYNYDKEFLCKDIDLIKNFDNGIAIRQANLDMKSRKITVHPVG